jgi:hypothetical protein
MASDGINFHFVPQDIEAGSLIAYVVHKADPEARYPLMRQLIKPFKNQQGETILVPARIYGGEGHSLVRDALSQTLTHFVQRQNANQIGEFHMDRRLYADGQGQVVRLQGGWSADSIKEAVTKYQAGSIQEWITELGRYELLLSQDKRGEYGEDPAETIGKLKKKLSRVYDAGNKQTGLPRMFFREMLKSSIGSIPHPKDIYRAISDDPDLKLRAKAFEALIKEDEIGWQSHAAKLLSEERVQIALVAALSLSTQSDKEPFAVKAWEDSLEGLPPFKQHQNAKNAVVNSSPNSFFHKRAYILVLDTIDRLPPEERSALGLNILLSLPPGSELNERAGKIALDYIEHRDLISSTAIAVMRNVAKGTPLHERAATITLDHISDVYAIGRQAFFTDIMKASDPDSAIYQRAATMAIDDIAELPAEQRFDEARKIMRIVGSAFYNRAAMAAIAYMGDIKIGERFSTASYFVSGLPEGSLLQKQAVETALTYLSDEPAAKRFSATQGVRAKLAQGSSLCGYVDNIALDTISDLPPAERHEAALRIRHQTSVPALKERATSIALDNIAELPRGKRFDAARMLMIYLDDKSSNMERAAGIALDHIMEVDGSCRAAQATNIMCKFSEGTQIHERAAKLALDHVTVLPPQERLDELMCLMRDLSKASQFHARASEAALITLSELPMGQQFEAARHMMCYLAKGSIQMENAGKIALEHINLLPRREQGYEAEAILEKITDKTLRGRAKQIFRREKPLTSLIIDIKEASRLLGSRLYSVISPQRGLFAQRMTLTGHDA